MHIEWLVAWHAAYAAFREVLPEMPEAQAKLETTHATAYVAANHTKWFWGGVAGRGTSCTARPASARVIRFNWLQDSRVVVVRLVHPRSRSATVMGSDG